MVSEFRVGVISSTHGIRGEVKVFPTTDDPARFRELKQVTLVRKRERRAVEIEKVRFFKQFVIVKFRGIDDINDIELYKGAELWIDREQAVPLEDGEYFIADLIGLSVMTDGGERLGTLQEVLRTGANDVYEVLMENGRTVLLPVTGECVLDVDLEKGEVLVHMLDGLLDL
ncbi:MAG: 16S rRNA processing protein RimM [Lachnospiraceae bacterium]|nr:16S rRNA processing protein RimM [Lachnospiraceae bacterium]